MGIANRPPTSDELASMQRELQDAMEAGCFGFSSGLEYPPSAYADENELTELCRVLVDYGGFYATHLRNEGDMLVEAVQEALNVSERAGVPLQLSHHKAEGPANWGKTAVTLPMVEAVRARGHDVQTDQYPYTAFMTALSIQVLPRWALAGAVEETSAKLHDPDLRARIAADMRMNHPEWDDVSAASFWKDLQIGVCRGRPETQGRSILALAVEAGQLPIDYVLDLLAEVQGYVSAVNFAIAEEDIARVMRYPWTSIGSDGVGTHPEGSGGADKIHPRAYGTFPRVLGHYVRELGVLSEANAIHKMTALPAARLGLKDRGRLAPGQFADITVYDPATIEDCASFSDPHQYPRGVRLVLVNGRIALENERPNGSLHGRVLRKN
jgi:N-acyl-D-amino-acid deacylase